MLLWVDFFSRFGLFKSTTLPSSLKVWQKFALVLLIHFLELKKEFLGLAYSSHFPPNHVDPFDPYDRQSHYISSSLGSFFPSSSHDTGFSPLILSFYVPCSMFHNLIFICIHLFLNIFYLILKFPHISIYLFQGLYVSHLYFYILCRAVEAISWLQAWHSINP